MKSLVLLHSRWNVNNGHSSDELWTFMFKHTNYRCVILIITINRCYQENKHRTYYTGKHDWLIVCPWHSLHLTVIDFYTEGMVSIRSFSYLRFILIEYNNNFIRFWGLTCFTSWILRNSKCYCHGACFSPVLLCSYFS